MVTFTVLEFIIGLGKLSSCQKPVIGFLTCEMRAVMVGEVTLKTLELNLPTKIVNPSQY